MPVPPPDLHRGWTLHDLDTLPDDGQRYELVDGGLVVTPRTTQRHQDLGHDLRDRLQGAAPDGWRVRLEFPLPFARDTQRIPMSSSTAGRCSIPGTTSATGSVRLTWA